MSYQQNGILQRVFKDSVHLGCDTVLLSCLCRKTSLGSKWKQMLRFGSDIVLCCFYRLTVNGQPKAADLTSLLMLHSVATAFKSLLRPSDLSSHDKGPAESLAGNYRVIILFDSCW